MNILRFTKMALRSTICSYIQIVSKTLPIIKLAEALEIYLTIVYACTAVFWRHWLFWFLESLTIDIKTLVI